MLVQRCAVPWAVHLFGPRILSNFSRCKLCTTCQAMCNTPAVLLWSCRNTRCNVSCCLPLLQSSCSFFCGRGSFIFPSPSSFDRLLLWPAAMWPNDDFASGSCASFLFSFLLPRGKQLLTAQKPDCNRRVFDTPTVDSLQVWRNILIICTALLFTKTSKPPKISTMVNDCLAVRDSHQHRLLQHLSPGSEGTILACLRGYLFIYIYVCVCVCVYYYVCVPEHIYMQLHAIYLSLYLSSYLAIQLSSYPAI